MAQRRPFGSVYRRRRTGRSANGARRDGYHPGWYVRYRRDGKEVTRYGGATRAEAEAHLERIRRRLERQDGRDEDCLPEISFEDYAREYLAFSRRDHSPSTSRTRRSLVEGKLVPFFREVALVDIGPRDVERLLAQSAHAGPATRNRILSALSAMFERAIELDYVRQNPTRACRRAREHETPLPLISIPEQNRLISALPPDKRTLFLTALDTGARLGELLRTQWSDVEFDTASILLRKTKGHRPRIVRLSQRALGALRASHLATAEATDRVFDRAVGRDGNLRWSWRRAFKRAAASVGRPALRVHDLRHLAAINLVRAGVDLPTIQAHLGHKHLVSTLRYAAYSDKTASARAAHALDLLFGEDPEASG